jgi:hypothetical protein
MTQAQPGCEERAEHASRTRPSCEYMLTLCIGFSRLFSIAVRVVFSV